MNWKYSDASRRVVGRVLEDGRIESCLVDALDAEERAAVLEPDPPAPATKDELDAAAARQYAKLKALAGMTPAQVQAWVDANVTDLPSARDAIKTLAIAVSTLARRL